MGRLRRLLARIAFVWLLGQAATLLAVPLLFWDTSAEALLECTCAHGDHAICPMHHRPIPGRCQMRSAADPAVDLLASVTIGVSTLPATSAIVLAADDPTRAAVDESSPSMRPTPPDPPPPRA